MATVTVVGASGAVGRRLFPFLRRSLSQSVGVVGTYFSHPVTDCVPLDITNPEAVRQHLGKYQPTTVIWLSGTKDVRKCEQDPDFAHRLNSAPVESLVKTIETSSPRTRVLYLSTDYVFDGARGSYEVGDVCTPATHYGRSKLAAESTLRASKVDHLILRTSAIMMRDDGFLGWLLAQLRSGQTVDLFSNTYFSPTPMELLNRAVATLIDRTRWTVRVLHVAGGRMSRSHFGTLLATSLGLDVSRVHASLADFGSTTFQPDLSLVTSAELQEIAANSWDELLREASGA